MKLGTIERDASDAGRTNAPNCLGHGGFQRPRSLDVTVKFTF